MVTRILLHLCLGYILSPLGVHSYCPNGKKRIFFLKKKNLRRKNILRRKKSLPVPSPGVPSPGVPRQELVFI